MSPHEQNPVDDVLPKQSLFIVRHGDRWDYSYPSWRKTATRLGDPPLSTLGHRQAREVGSFLDTLLFEDGVHAEDVTVLSSPFLRCVQTSNEILSEFHKTPGNVSETVLIKPEYSVFELDGHDGKLHADLPTLTERKCYFPRLDDKYESMFVPPLPETKISFLTRCDKAINQLNKRYPFNPKSAIIIVTHAAGCVALAKSAAGVTLADINAAYPCGIFQLTRTSNSPRWNIDHYSKPGGMNGYTDHLSDLGKHTVPWNHFGVKSSNDGYSGPPLPTLE